MAGDAVLLYDLRWAVHESATAWWLLSLTVAVGGLYVAGTWTHSHFRRRGLPFARPLPFLGSMAPLTFHLVSFPEFIQDLYFRYKDLPMFGVFQFYNPVVVVRDPELVRLVAVKEFDHFVDHKTTVSPKLDPIIGKNLFSLKGQEWKEMRATLTPAFTSSKMRNIFKLIDTCGQQMAQYIQKELDKSPSRMFEAQFKDFFSRFSNDVIATVAFGIQVDSLKDPQNEFFRMGAELTDTKGFKTLLFLGFMLSPRFMELLGMPFVPAHVKTFFSDIVHGAIRERQRQGVRRQDMLQLLMQARAGELRVEQEDAHEAEDVKADKKKLTDDDITAQAVIFFFAGFDTISSTLGFAAHLLARHPHVQRRLQAEVDAALDAGGGALTYEAAQRMKYLDMVMSETLRLYPPVAFLDRCCVKEFTFPPRGALPAYTLRRGDSVWLPVHALHLDPEHWPEPRKFDPERFSEENKANIKPFTYIPFGAGPRVCIGPRFSFLEMKVGLVHILRHFSFVPCDKTPEELSFVKGDFTTSAEGGFRLALAPRCRE